MADQVSKERLQAILFWLYYARRVEIIERMEKFPWHYTLDFVMITWKGTDKNEFELRGEEVYLLVESNILDLDGGCEESGFEERLFVLSDEARLKMDEMICERGLSLNA